MISPRSAGLDYRLTAQDVHLAACFSRAVDIKNIIIRILQLDAKVSSKFDQMPTAYMPIYNNTVYYSSRETAPRSRRTRYRNNNNNNNIWTLHTIIALGRGFSGITHRVHETRHSFVFGRIVKGFAAHDVYAYTYVQCIVWVGRFTGTIIF